MSAPARVDALIAYEQVTAWLQARQLRVLAVMAADPMLSCIAPELDKRWVKEDVRAALGESAVGAGNRLDLATQLTTQLPATLTALEHGQLTMRQARHLADAVLDLDDAPARAVQTAVLPGAAGQDLATFRRHVRRAVLAADPRTAAEAHADELAKRRIAILPGEHGMGTLFGYLPADALQAIITALDVKADQCPTGDPRTKDQQRADALTQLAIDALNGHPTCPDMRPSRQQHRQQHRHRVQPSTTAPDPTPNSTDRFTGRAGIQHPAVAGPTPVGPGDDRPVHPARLRPATRRTGRTRTHPHRPGPTPGRRPHRHLAPPHHRRTRPATGLRPHHLPATSGPHPPRHRPRPNLPLPHLQPQSPPLRTRSHPPLAHRRDHRHHEPQRTMPPPPPRQTRRRLATTTTHRRDDPLDLPHRTHLPRPRQQLPDRPHHRNQTTHQCGRASTHRSRPRPAAPARAAPTPSRRSDHRPDPPF